MCFSPFLQPQVLFTTNEPQSYVFGGRNHPLHSNSQKAMLESYAAQHGFTNCVHYTDDGWSGANFERPSWKRLVADIEAGKVGCVIAKDMSRVGRDYLQTGFYTEILFREKGVRFIAISNGVDSFDHNSGEFAPFLNIMKAIHCSGRVLNQFRVVSAIQDSLIPLS